MMYLLQSHPAAFAHGQRRSVRAACERIIDDSDVPALKDTAAVVLAMLAGGRRDVEGSRKGWRCSRRPSRTRTRECRTSRKRSQ
jgi:hypothetical protein